MFSASGDGQGSKGLDEALVGLYNKAVFGESPSYGGDSPLEQQRGRPYGSSGSFCGGETAGEQTFTNEFTARERGRNGACFSETFVTISYINLRTEPSHLPPPSRPPPLVNVKSDASSAALKEAMYKAQVKLKNAKEVLERNREGSKSSIKIGSKSDGKVEEKKDSKAVNGKKLIDADELGECEKWVYAQEKDNELGVGLAVEEKKNGQEENETSKSTENPKKVHEYLEREDEKKSWREIENEKRLKQERLQEVNEREHRKALYQKDTEKKQKEVFEKDESKRSSKVVIEQGKDEMLEEVIEHRDYIKQVKEVQDTENEVKQKVVELEETEDLKGENNAYQKIERDESGKKKKIALENHQYEERESCGLVSHVVSNLDCNRKCQDNQLLRDQGLKFAYEWRGRARHVKEAHVPLHLEENKDNYVTAQPVKESFETERQPEAVEASELGKGSVNRTFQHVKIRQSTERNDKNIDDNIASEEEVERQKREGELEKERLRTIEEERERERENDRMAVNRTLLEAHERAERAALEEQLLKLIKEQWQRHMKD
ncbi:hypothetical protein F3Y22_tig00117034pilonHSYRG00684 [Hibiscus syriacus]|uniref:Uncharacterized protein n=1 Tax=Hibiscus syriacus TaxID=106335 RepID=A0A6A2XEV6_HIBSY|nr:hypothetical protein F3Y22_tig00117034pilonHSYRG00684 [Hibiscus syriacus]